jgi:thiol-disulfide isomerase/thioredoxin
MKTQLFFALGLCAILLSAARTPVSAQVLQVGSKAPAIDIEHWISDGNGAYPRVTKFVPGKTYVIEFWATWCGPCLKAMPHLAQLQEKYGDKIQFISVTDESLPEITELLAQDYPGTGKTFGELTSAYCLTSDPDGSTHRDYMEASQASGIPTAYVVGPTGQIEMIGHPMSLDGVLKMIAAGNWDRESYYAAIEKRESLMAAIDNAVNAEDLEKAFTLAKQLTEVTPPNELVRTKFIQTQLAIRVGNEDAIEFFKDTAEQLKDEDGGIAAMVWMIVEMKYEGEQPNPALIKTAEQILSSHIAGLSDSNADRRMMKGAVMDILSHLYYVQDRLDDAIANQVKAVSFNNDAELTDFLKQLKKEKAAQ